MTLQDPFYKLSPNKIPQMKLYGQFKISLTRTNSKKLLSKTTKKLMYSSNNLKIYNKNNLIYKKMENKKLN